MIRRKDLLEKLERDLIRKNRSSYLEKLRIFEAMFQEAKHFGVLPPQDPLEGIEVDIRIAKAVNVRKPPRKSRPRSRQK